MGTFWSGAILALAIACVAWTVTQEEICREVRDYLQAWEKRSASIVRRKLAYLVKCPYCLSHWITAAVIIGCDFRLVVDDVRGQIVALFVLVFLANTYLTVYQLGRVALRWAKTTADQAEGRTRWDRSEHRLGNWALGGRL